MPGPIRSVSSPDVVIDNWPTAFSESYSSFLSSVFCVFFFARAASILFDYFVFFPRFVSRLLWSDCLSNDAGYRLQSLISEMTRSWWELASRLRPWPPVDTKTDGCPCACLCLQLRTAKKADAQQLSTTSRGSTHEGYYGDYE